jgi:hypothetical protein
MNSKISMGYGGVEFLDGKGFNIITKPTPLKSEDGLVVGEVTCGVVKMENLTFMHKFLDEILFERVYVKPVEVATGGGVSSASFLVNGKFFLNVIADTNGGVHPSLMKDKDSILKFSYEGDTLERFFDEIRKDIEDILSR